MTGMARATVRMTLLVLLGVLMVGMTGWGVLALFYWDHASPLLRGSVAVAYGLSSLVLLAGFASQRWRWPALGVFVLLFTVLVSCWRAIRPSNDREWQADNAVLAYATSDGEQVTLHNIRNFDYRTEHDFKVAYYDRTFDLRQLQEVDLFAVYWMGPAIAHVFLSFGFSDGSHVAVSIEARRERGEGYSSVRGFFRQYELYYVVADERDVVRLRTNYRRDPPEQVYLYRLQGSAASARQLFLEYLREINALRERARWYNTLTTNCTNTIWLNSRVIRGHLPYSWQILLSGYLPEFLYQHGRLDTRLPFAELRRRAHINALAQAADRAADFSQRIRSQSAYP
jgi:hypothetical protein